MKEKRGGTLRNAVRFWVMLGFVAPALAWAAYDPKDARDPFYPLLNPDGARREPKKPESRQAGSVFGGVLKLEGILYDAGGGSVAIVNGELFKTGDIREDIEVTRIEPARVMVLKNGTEVELKLPVPEADEEKP
ncbi:MAG: hypothetical protein HY594_00910 [Candidatus Omnitrophica bacterium]|nr:hypothetical protein [Candidatus Omnitrophota bacterium]